MAVKRSGNWASQIRADVPDMRAIESSVRNDFDELMAALILGDQNSMVIRGFEINMPGSIGNSANSLTMAVADSAFLHGSSTTAGTFFVVRPGAAVEILNSTVNPNVIGSFAPNSNNYVALDLFRQVDDTTSAPRAVWDPVNKIEVSKVLPLSETANFQIKITTSNFAANTLPVCVVVTDGANNVIAIQDRRPLLSRLGTAGFGAPNPAYVYPWTNQSEGRQENPSSSSNSNVNPFRGGDKMLKTLKEWMDAVMSILREIKGTNYWYSFNVGGSLPSLRTDAINTIITSAGFMTHDAVTSGKLNWSQDIYLRIVGSRLAYKIAAYAAGNNVILADNQIAYINLVRDEVISNPLIFTNGSPTVQSVGSVTWTTGLVAGDFIRQEGTDDSQYYQILTVDSLSQVTLTENFGGTSTGVSGNTARYAWGVYQTSASPSTDRHVFIANRHDVPINQDMFWIAFRDDNGGATPKIFTRFKSGELEKGESISVGDETSRELLLYIGSSSEADATPEYSTADGAPTANNVITDGDNLTQSIKRLDTAVGTGSAVSNQDRSLKMVRGGTWSWALGGLTPGNQAVNTSGGGSIAFSVGSGGGSTLFFGQGFTATSTGNITSAQVALRGNGATTGNILARIYSYNAGVPGSLLGTSNPVDSSTFGTGSIPFGLVTFTFASPIAVTNATQYFLVIDNSGHTAGTIEIEGNNTGNPYAGGNAITSNTSGASWTQVPLRDYRFSIDGNVAASAGTVTWSSDAFVQVPGLVEVRNRIAAGNAILANDGQVAYVDINRSGTTPAALAVTVADIDSVGLTANTVIIARRIGGAVVIGTSTDLLQDGQSTALDQQMSDQNLQYIGAPSTASSAPAHSSNIRGTAGQSLLARQGVLTDAMGDAQEDRSSYLRSDEPVTWTGTQLAFTQDIVLEFVNTKSGALHAYTILLANSPINLINGESAWVLIDRSLVTANLTLNFSSVTPIPAQTQANKDVFVLFRRVDALGAGYMHIPLHKQVLEPGQSVRLGASGSGDGGGNEYLERMREVLEDSQYDLLTDTVFSIAKATMTDVPNTTAAYNLIKKGYAFTLGQKWTSIQMLDTGYLAEGNHDIQTVDVAAFWRAGEVDANATYRVSRNDGNEYQAVTMTRVPNTDAFYGTLTFAPEAANQIVASNTTGGSLVSEVLNNTTAQQFSQLFTIAAPWTTKQLSAVTVTKTGAAVGYLYFEIRADNAGVPGALLATSNTFPLASMGVGPNVIVPTIAAALPAGSYHIVAQTDATYKFNFSAGVTQIALNTRSGSAAPNAQIWNGTAWSALTSEAFHYSLDGRILVAKLEVTSSAGTVTLMAVGLYYGSSSVPTPGLDVSALLTDNRLGSTTPSRDRSVAGEGILLRATNGKLVEVSVVWNGVSYEVVFGEVQ